MNTITLQLPALLITWVQAQAAAEAITPAEWITRLIAETHLFCTTTPDMSEEEIAKAFLGVKVAMETLQ